MRMGSQMENLGTKDGNFRPLTSNNGLNERAVPGNSGDQNQDSRHDEERAVGPNERAATPEIAAEIMGGTVQASLTALFGEAGSEVPLLYGGSVNPSNVASFAAVGCINGALVGGASLQADQFLEIVQATAAAKI